MRGRSSSQPSDVACRWRGLSIFLALAIVLISLSLIAPPQAHAGGSGAIISWDSSMIFPGQNSGNPWGPVGEAAKVHGQQFAANTTYYLTLVPGDTTSDPTVCQNAGITVVNSVTSDATGNFDASFLWPAAAGTVGQTYSICGRVLSDGSLYSILDGTGPFTVLASNPPAIQLASNPVTAGDTLTVTGQNWVPPQPVKVTISTCFSCSPTITKTVNSTGLNTGTFSVDIPIPADLPAGNYAINATAQALDASNNEAIPTLVVNPPAVPSPAATVTPTPTPTATAVPSPTAVATANAGSNNTAPASTDNTPFLLPIVLGAIGLVVLIIVALLVFMLARRRPRSPEVAPTVPSMPVQAGPYNSPVTPPPSNFRPPVGITPALPISPPPASVPVTVQNSVGQAGYTPVLQNEVGHPGPQVGSQPDFNQPTLPASGPSYPPVQRQVPPAPNNLLASGICARCGTPLDSGALFCGNCGATVGGQSDPDQLTRHV